MILLDTHAWVWWAAGSSRLPEKLRHRIDAEPEKGIAAISLWEVAMLESKGRIQFDRPVLEWLREASALPGLDVHPLTPEIAAFSASLPADFQKDPADRMIAATAIVSRVPLVTRDAALRGFRSLETIWQ